MQSSFFIFLGGCYNQKSLIRMRQRRQSKLLHCNSLWFQGQDGDREKRGAERIAILGLGPGSTAEPVSYAKSRPCFERGMARDAVASATGDAGDIRCEGWDSPVFSWSPLSGFALLRGASAASILAPFHHGVTAKAKRLRRSGNRQRGQGRGRRRLGSGRLESHSAHVPIREQGRKLRLSFPLAARSSSAPDSLVPSPSRGQGDAHCESGARTLGASALTRLSVAAYSVNHISTLTLALIVHQGEFLHRVLAGGLFDRRRLWTPTLFSQYHLHS